MMRADGHQASTSTVERALRRRGLLLPRGFRADRKSWAALRRKVFHDPPTERNRVWQTDFSEFETAGGGIWRICAVIDYATKYCLAAKITPTGRGVDALACLDAAVDEAERVLGLDDMRVDRGELELVDENTGEVIDIVPAPIAVVSDNGSCFRGETYQTAFAGDDPLLRHVRTRVRSPQTNGVIERFFGTLKYEHLYRAPIDDGGALAMETARFRDIYNRIRPHQSSRRSNTAPGLPRHVTRRPTEGPVTATRHRAGLARHPVIELTGDRSQRRSCAGGGSASGTAWRAARDAVTINRPIVRTPPVMPPRGIPEELGHGRAPGSSWRTRGASSRARARACGGPQGP